MNIENENVGLDETECIDIKINDELLSHSKCFLNAYTLHVEEGDSKAYTPKNFPNEAVYVLIVPEQCPKISIFLKTRTGEWDSIVDGKGKLSPDQLAGFFKTQLFQKIIDKLEKSWPLTDAFYKTLFNCLKHKKICIDPPGINEDKRNIKLKDKEHTWKPEKNHYAFQNGKDDYLYTTDFLDKISPNVSSWGSGNWFKGTSDCLKSENSRIYAVIDDGNDTKVGISDVKRMPKISGIQYIISGEAGKTTDITSKMLNISAPIGSMRPNIVIYMNDSDESVYACNEITHDGDDIILKMEWSDAVDYQPLDKIGESEQQEQSEKKIVFIDFDGVVIPIPYKRDIKKNGGVYEYKADQGCIDNLKKICDETGAKIVYSTSWKKFSPDAIRNFDGRDSQNQTGNITQLLSGYINTETPQTPNLPPQVFPKNGKKYDCLAKADEIQKFLDEHQDVKSYVIFDDVDFMSGNLSGRFGKNYIQTNNRTGITNEDADMAIEILENSTDTKKDIDEDGEFDKARIDKEKSRGTNVAGKQIYSNSGRKLVTFSDFGVKHTDEEAYFCWPAIGKEFKWSQWYDWEKIKPVARCRFQHNSYLYGFSLSPFQEDDKNRGFRGYNLTLEPKLQYITPIETQQAMGLSIMQNFLRLCIKRISTFINIPDEEIFKKVDDPARCTIEQIKKTKSVMKNTLKAIRDKRHDTYMYD